MTKAEERTARFVAMTNANREAGVVQRLADYLKREHWSVVAHPGNQRGPDIDAKKDGRRWLIEAKGCIMNEPAGNSNSFRGAVADVCIKRPDDAAKYSMALPDLPVFRRHWARLPPFTKRALAITCIFVPVEGDPVELSE